MMNQKKANLPGYQKEDFQAGDGGEKRQTRKLLTVSALNLPVKSGKRQREMLPVVYSES
jgi:hypothetical protein